MVMMVMMMCRLRNVQCLRLNACPWALHCVPGQACLAWLARLRVVWWQPAWESALGCTGSTHGGPLEIKPEGLGQCALVGLLRFSVVMVRLFVMRTNTILALISVTQITATCVAEPVEQSTTNS